MKNWFYIGGLLFVLIFNFAASYSAVLNYQPVGKKEPVKNIDFFIEPVKDLRPDPTLLGAYKDEQFVKKFDIRPASNVSMWVSDALKEELQIAGYGISRSHQGFQIDTSLLEAACDFYGEFYAHIKMSVRVKRDDTVLIDKNYIGEITIGAFATDKECGRVLGIALQDTMKKIIKDINQVACRTTSGREG